MVNKVILIGRLTADPDVRATASGTHVTNLRLATNTYAGKEDDGTRREHTDFHSLVAFGKTAEFAAEHLRKGRLLYAEGRSQTRSWETNDGQRRYSTEVVVDAIQLLSPRPEEPS
ncbi:MAG TPA: single-stranded DNA-binding protein [Terriglobales bacterium]|nr:single-stranded DNA-binding protein [Terriglobales bacterium]